MSTAFDLNVDALEDFAVLLHYEARLEALEMSRLLTLVGVRAKTDLPR